MNVTDLNMDHAQRLTQRRRNTPRRAKTWAQDAWLTRRLLGRARGQHVLELGPGLGRFHRAMKRRFTHVHAVDLNPDHVRRLQTLGYHVNEGLVEQIGRTFRGHAFDVTFSRHVLEHVTGIHEVLSDLYALTKPGGWALHEVPLPPYFEPAHVTELYPHEWARAFQDAGYTVYECKPARALGRTELQIKARKGNHLEDPHLRDMRYWQTMGAIP